MGGWTELSSTLMPALAAAACSNPVGMMGRILLRTRVQFLKSRGWYSGKSCVQWEQRGNPFECLTALVMRLESTEEKLDEGYLLTD